MADPHEALDKEGRTVYERLFLDMRESLLPEFDDLVVLDVLRDIRKLVIEKGWKFIPPKAKKQ